MILSCWVIHTFIDLCHHKHSQVNDSYSIHLFSKIQLGCHFYDKVVWKFWLGFLSLILVQVLNWNFNGLSYIYLVLTENIRTCSCICHNVHELIAPITYDHQCMPVLQITWSWKTQASCRPNPHPHSPVAAPGCPWALACPSLATNDRGTTPATQNTRTVTSPHTVTWRMIVIHVVVTLIAWQAPFKGGCLWLHSIHLC